MKWIAVAVSGLIIGFLFIAFGLATVSQHLWSDTTVSSPADWLWFLGR